MCSIIVRVSVVMVMLIMSVVSISVVGSGLIELDGIIGKFLFLM